jgi:hypothetical protein
MKLTKEREELSKLLLDIDKKDIYTRKKMYLVSILPIALAIILMTYFFIKIMNYREQVIELQKEVTFLNYEIDSLNSIYKHIEYNFSEDFGWSEKDVLNKDSFRLSQSKEAHQRIINLLISHKIDVKSTIRYYTKRVDKGKIDDVLLKCGFRNIKVFTTYYRDKSPTNTISYSFDVPENNIKVIAYSLIRAGIEVKSIEPYPKSMQRKKYKSIEISGNKNYINKKGFHVIDVDNFKKRTK